MSCALFEAFPALEGRIPFRPLGRFPTRVHHAGGIVSPAVELWVKRDDESGVLYGGNKVRKLEFLLGDALARGRERLVTLGGYGSHHVLATALYGRQVGLPLDAVVYPQPVTPHVLATIRAGRAAGTRYHATGGYLGVPGQLVPLLLSRRSHFIAAGGSSPIGTLGWVSAGLEIAAQIERRECPPFDVIYVALGSCGTAAGLLLGLRLAGLPARVIGVQVVPSIVCNARITLGLARRTAALLSGALDRRLVFKPGPFAVDPRFFGGAYGRATGEAARACERASTAGLTLETTYTGKAFAALLADADAGLLDGKRALFVHTFSSVDLAELCRNDTAGSVALPERLIRLLEPSASENDTPRE